MKQEKIRPPKNAPVRAPEAAVNLRIDAKGFCRAVAAVDRVVEARNTIPILGYCRIRAADGKIMVAGTDLDMMVEREVEGGGDGALTLPCRTLAKLLRGVDEAVEHISIVQTPGERAEIVAGNLTFKLATLPVEDWPGDPFGKMPAPNDTIIFPEGTLPWLLAPVRPCISTEETRYYLNGVCFQRDKDDPTGLRAIATDGHRFGSRVLRLDGEAPDFGADMILPRKLFPLLLPTAGQAEVEAQFWWPVPTGETEVVDGLVPSKRHVMRGRLAACFRGKGWTIWTKTIDGTYPDWSRIVPKGDMTTTVTLEVAPFRRFLAAAAAFGSNTREFYGEKCVTFERAPGGVCASLKSALHAGGVAATIPGGWAGGEEIKARTPGSKEPHGLGINRAYLAAAIAGRTGTVTLRFRYRGMAVEIDPEHEGDIVLIMPMRA